MGSECLGLAQAEALVDRLVAFAPQLVAAGPEPRMGQTVAPLADALGVRLLIDDGLAESHAGGWLDDAEFAAMIEAYFARPDSAPAPGWEPAATAAARFVAAIETWASGSETTTVVCSGGRVISAVLCRLGMTEWSAGLTTCRSLAMPDVLSLEGGESGWSLTSR